MNTEYRKKINILEILITFIIFCSLGFPGNFTLLVGDVFDDIIGYFCFVLQLIIMFLGFNGKIKIRKSYIPAYIFLILIFVTSMIVTRYPGLQIISCVRFTTTACFGLWIASKYDVEKITKFICNAQVLFVIITIIFTLVFTENAFENNEGTGLSFCGLYLTKNTCGTELAFGIIMTILSINVNKKRLSKIMGGVIFIVIQLVLLLMCNTTGALIAAVIPSVFILFLSNIKVNMGIVFTAGNVLFLFFVLKILPHLSKFMSLIGKDVTLTGRTDLWKRVIHVMSNHNTFTGFGYAMFWRDTAAYRMVQKGFNKYSFMANMTAGSHNLIMEMWLNLGIIGILAFLIMLIISMRNPAKQKLNSYKFAGAFIIFFLIHGLFERAFGTFDYNTLFLFTAIGISAIKYQSITE
ncbi:MAG: O-antigen ligase family protein [Lachnospirales bacterium]